MKIIAEIGWNHLGDMQLAAKMIKAAAKSGATHAKFQTWSTKHLKSGPWDLDGRRKIYEKAELSEENHRFLSNACKKNNIAFLTSCFSYKDVAFISSMCDEIKIPSTELCNASLIEEIRKRFSCKQNHHIYVSTGTCTVDEIEDFVRKMDGMNFTLMHCVSVYPTPPELCNMSRLTYLNTLHNSVGYSGHYPGIEDAIVALEFGVSTIEKHFTTNKKLPGRDNLYALTPKDLKRLTNFVSNREKMLAFHGNGFISNEIETRELYRGRWDDLESS